MKAFLLYSFLRNYNIIPNWINCNFSWTEARRKVLICNQWSWKQTTLFYQIEIGEADLALPDFGCRVFPNETLLVHCTQPVKFVPYHFYSRFPLETTKLWNLKNLLTRNSWIAYFTTIILISFYLKFLAYVSKKLGLKTVIEEIALMPFRCLIQSIKNLPIE